MYTINIEDEIYLALEKQARAKGQAPEELAENILAQHVAGTSEVHPALTLSPEERLAILKSMMRPISDHVDYSRDAIYP